MTKSITICGVEEVESVIQKTFNITEQIYENHTEADYVLTSYKGIDDVSGLMPGDLVIVSGSAGSGLSSFTINLYHRLGVSVRSVPTLLCSLQHDRHHVGRALLCLEGRLAIKSLRRAKLRANDWPKLVLAVGRLTNDSPLFLYSGTINLTELHQLIKKYHQEKKLRVLIVDSLHLLANRYDYEQVLRELKILAVKLKITVVITCTVGTRYNSHSYSEIINDRSQRYLEKYADVLLHIQKRRITVARTSIGEKEGYYFELDELTGMMEWNTTDLFIDKYKMVVNILKNTHGPSVGAFELVFTPAYCLIEESCSM